MPTTKYIQSSFTSGEISNRLFAHTDFAKYKNGLALCENYLPLVHGPIMARDGLRFVAEAKYDDKAAVLLPFEFSTVQAYILEFGEFYIRFYKDAGRIESPPGTPVEVATAYAEADLTTIRSAQSADTLYLVHGLYPPQKLTRTSHTDWQLNEVEFTDGPYLDENKETTKTLAANYAIVPAAITITNVVNNGSGLFRVTATAHGLVSNDYVLIEDVVGVPANGVWKVTVIDANTYDLQASTFSGAYTSGGSDRRLATITAAGHTPFQSGHVGSLWRIKVGASYGYVRVKQFLSTTQVVALVETALGGTSATSTWREGAWSGVRGYPCAVTIYEQRLVFAATSHKPQTIWGSVSDSYEDFTPGTADADPFTYTLGSNKMNVIRWLTSGLLLIPGTMGEEFTLEGPNNSGLTPTNVRARSQTAHGSAPIQAVRVGTAAIFVQRSGKKVRQLTFSQEASGLSSSDLTLLSHHIPGPGISAIAYQQEPETVMWAIRKDGVLLSLTFLPAQEVAGWARHITQGKFESVAVIPSADSTSDSAWFVVQRTIGGVTKRFIEYGDPLLAVDSGLSYDGAITAATVTPGAVTGSGVTFTASSAVFVAQDVGKDIVLSGPLTVGATTYTNCRATITAYTDATHVIAAIVNDFPNTSPIAAGAWALAVQSVAGLDHLEGETVSIVGDGAVYPSKVVNSGAVVLDGMKANVIHVGLAFTPKAKLLEPEVTKGDGDTILGLKKRFARLFVRVFETNGLWIDGLLESPVRSTSDPLGTAPTLFTGDIECTQLGFEDKAVVTLEQRLPLKSTILGLWGTLEYAEQ